MSESKWTIVNGIKYPNTDVDTIFEYQTEEDVEKTTRNEIYFPNYIVILDEEDKMTFKRRKLN